MDNKARRKKKSREILNVKEAEAALKFMRNYLEQDFAVHDNPQELVVWRDDGTLTVLHSAKQTVLEDEDMLLELFMQMASKTRAQEGKE
jgi:urocanate hydratase